jgi:hypothetical protein
MKKSLAAWTSVIILIFGIYSCKDKDTTAPVITLDGYNPSYTPLDSSYTEPGYSAIDDVDGDITDQVMVSGSVDTQTEGTYYLYYDVKDAAGNNAIQQIRTVKVAIIK